MIYETFTMVFAAFLTGEARRIQTFIALCKMSMDDFSDVSAKHHIKYGYFTKKAINGKDHDTELKLHERFSKYGFSAKPMLDFLRSHSDPELLFAQPLSRMMKSY